MKLHCESVNKDFEDLFTKGKLYNVHAISRNRVMVSVTCDTGHECAVIYDSSVYGKFTLLEEV